ncbi:hypothetical protein [Candidatus Lokiarchaeum ossiferum]|uniref:hypothetical protein n=1 Tax=Candidatus Lokiarchaeum ossiferum TaxID=2951803 RepID=UPI00352E2EB8
MMNYTSLISYYQKYGLLLDYLMLSLLIGLIQRYIPFAPAYGAIVVLIGSITIHSSVKMYRLVREPSTSKSLNRKWIFSWFIELILLGGITTCVLLCSKYSWTWDFSPAREALYVHQFAVFSTVLYVALGVILVFHGLTVVKTPVSSQPKVLVSG